MLKHEWREGKLGGTINLACTWHPSWGRIRRKFVILHPLDRSYSTGLANLAEID